MDPEAVAEEVGLTLQLEAVQPPLPPLMELDQIKFLPCCLALCRFPESPPERRKLLKMV